MLYDAIKAARGGHPVISASRMRADGRIIGADGKRIPCQPESILFYDGAIYAGNLDNMGIWFTLASASKVIINQDMSVCDIDTPLDLLNHTRFTL